MSHNISYKHLQYSKLSLCGLFSKDMIKDNCVKPLFWSRREHRRWDMEVDHPSLNFLLYAHCPVSLACWKIPLSMLYNMHFQLCALGLPSRRCLFVSFILPVIPVKRKIGYSLFLQIQRWYFWYNSTLYKALCKSPSDEKKEREHGKKLSSFPDWDGMGLTLDTAF